MAATTTSGPTEHETTTIRIVFDGAPFAGKTTAAYSLAEAMGGTASTPEEADGRTVWFDWMTYTGGRHNGKAIRVELVTVPGQEALADRRRHLISWADVVVFIADSSASAFEETAEKFVELQADLAASDMTGETIVVANKRDLDDALPIEDIRSRLGIAGSDILVEGIATDGGGLRQAFIFAIRAALAATPDRPDVMTADALLEEMQARLSVDEPSDVTAPAVNADTQASVGSSSALDEVAELDVVVEPDAATGEAGEAESFVDASNDDAAPGVDDNPGEAVPRTVTVADPPASESIVDVDVVGDSPADVGQAPEIKAEPSAVEPAESQDTNQGETYLVNARLQRSALEQAGSVVLFAEHWRGIAAIANGRSTLTLDDGSRDAQAVKELLEWGLVLGEIQTGHAAAPAETAPQTPSAAVEALDVAVSAAEDESDGSRALDVAVSAAEDESDESRALDVPVVPVTDVFDDLVPVDTPAVVEEERPLMSDEELDSLLALHGNASSVESDTGGITSLLPDLDAGDLDAAEPELTPVEGGVASPDSEEPGIRNERYRALRELRRTLRSY